MDHLTKEYTRLQRIADTVQTDLDGVPALHTQIQWL